MTLDNICNSIWQVRKVFTISPELSAFLMHGLRDHAAVAWTFSDTFFNNDQRRRTPKVILRSDLEHNSHKRQQNNDNPLIHRYFIFDTVKMSNVFEGFTILCTSTEGQRNVSQKIGSIRIYELDKWLYATMFPATIGQNVQRLNWVDDRIIFLVKNGLRYDLITLLRIYWTLFFAHSAIPPTAFVNTLIF